jgi:NAD(P)-dependent dehydrogenase (short-subunit alcohol dehydrogenase family)
MANKIALVTGASRGIGKNIALKLAEKKINLIITYHNKKEEALKVVSEIKNIGGNAVALRLSAGEINTFDTFFEQAAKALKENFNTDHFDYLINNAGMGLQVPFAETSEKQFDELMNVQFKGVYFLVQKALNYLNEGGCIVNISSRLTQASMPGFSAYASMKGAVETLTRCLAKELSSKRIRVNAIAPGPIATGPAEDLANDKAVNNVNEKAAPVFDAAGRPKDVGGLAAFLCTDDAGWITAQRIEVSGFMVL